MHWPSAIQKRPCAVRGRVASAFCLVVGLATGISCSGASPHVSRPAFDVVSEPKLEVLKLRPLDGAETCFNGLDDNGNHLIDEGCGVAQSEVQFVLAWDDFEADIDLYVRDPDGEVASADGTTNLGLTLSGDCPQEKKICHGQNYENAYLEEPELAPGVYQVRLRVEKIPGEERSVVATLGVRLPARTVAHQVEFFHEGQEVILSFDVEAPPTTEGESKKK